MLRNWRLFFLFFVLALVIASPPHENGIFYKRQVATGDDSDTGDGGGDTPSRTPSPTRSPVATPSRTSSRNTPSPTPNPPSSEEPEPEPSDTPAPGPQPSDDPEPEPDSSTPEPTPTDDNNEEPNESPSPSPTGGNNDEVDNNDNNDNNNNNNNEDDPSETELVLSTRPIISSGIQEFTTTVFTEIDGVTVPSAVERTSAVEETVGFETTAVAPSLNNDDGDGDGDSGISSSTAKVIGGVVGGIGGAILLGGIAIVAWRLWKKKRQQNDYDQDDVFMTGAAEQLNRDKVESTSGTSPSPFRETLDQYHGPGRTNVNTASNF